MPRTRPDRAHEAQTLSFSVPRYIAEEFWAETDGIGWGKNTALFRKVWQAWKDDRSLREENARLRGRVLHLESAFRKVQTAVNDVAA